MRGRWEFEKGEYGMKDGQEGCSIRFWARHDELVFFVQSFMNSFITLIKQPTIWGLSTAMVSNVIILEHLWINPPTVSDIHSKLFCKNHIQSHHWTTAERFRAGKTVSMHFCTLCDFRWMKNHLLFVGNYCYRSIILRVFLSCHLR